MAEDSQSGEEEEEETKEDVEGFPPSVLLGDGPDQKETSKVGEQSVHESASVCVCVCEWENSHDEPLIHL